VPALSQKAGSYLAFDLREIRPMQHIAEIWYDGQAGLARPFGIVFEQWLGIKYIFTGAQLWIY
jgi:hypothetical protein